MVESPYDLPALGSLLAFEAAARRGGFKDAARERNVTPAAVSHRIKALEADLGCALFRRHHRGVELTEHGVFLQAAAQRGFIAMSEAIATLRAGAERAAVTIGATTAVSSLWLTPRLARFWKSHGDVGVSQILSDDDVAPASCDLSVRYGSMAKDGGLRQRLFRDRIVALGGPRFARENPVERVADLAALPLIHLEAAETGWTDWRAWCAAFGHDGPLGEGHRVNNYVIALQAAEDDMGAVLGWEGLTRPIVAAGRLSRLLPNAMASPMDFYVKLHPHAHARARLVFDWLCLDACDPG